MINNVNGATLSVKFVEEDGVVKRSRLRNAVLIALVIDVITVAYALLFGAYPSTPWGKDLTSYKILYVHVPASWDMYVAFSITLVGSILYLLKENVRFDNAAFGCSILGLIYGITSLVSGAIWANDMWGSPWSWDPRETSTLILWLAYLGYIALRASIGDLDRMRTVSSVYAVAAYITLPTSYFSATAFATLHEMLPEQPLGPEVYMLLVARVVVSFATFILVALLYYSSLTSKVRE